MEVIEFHRFGLGAGTHRPPPLMGRGHHHQEVELNYLFSGEVTYLHHWRRRALPLRRLVVFWGSVPHGVIETRPESEMAWATVPLSWLMQWKLPAGFVRRLLDGEWCEETRAEGVPERYPVRAWVEEINRDKPAETAAISLELQAMFTRLAASGRARDKPAARGGENGGNWRHVEAMARHMAEHFAEEIAMPDIARAAGLHPKYAQTLFRRWCGLTPGDYLRQHRVSHAQRLLLTTDAKVIDVALASGFGSPSAFYEAFQRATGATPAEFKRRGT